MAKSPVSKLKIPPHNTDAEMAFLGSIMVRPDAIYEVMDLVRPESFYSQKHKLIYEVIMELVSRGQPVDLLSLSGRLRERNELDFIGGATYLGALTESVPSSANIAHYAEIIHSKYLLRRLIEASEFIGGLGYEEEKHIEEVLDIASKKMYEVSTISGTQKFTPISDALEDAWERLDKLHKSSGGLRGVPTGFKDLDLKLSGLQKSDLIILAARPSMGKTSLALDIARHAAVDHNIPVGIFSLEMSTQQLVDRMLAAQSRVDAFKLRIGALSLDEEWGKIRDSLDPLSRAPIYIDDQPGNNIIKMRAVARRLKTEKDLGLIIVDYLQLMSPTQAKNSDNMVQQITEISRSLKHMARELHVPVLALSQLSRAVESRGGRPRLSDLRDSGSIEQDADVVMFIHRDDKDKTEEEKTNITDILIAKHRNGPTGDIKLYFDSKRSSYLSIDDSEYGGFNKDSREF